VTLQLAFIGLVMVAASLGSFYATEHFAAFNIVNIVGGSLALLAALILAVRSLRSVSGPYARGVILRGASWIVLAALCGAGLERAANRADIRYDWTFERRFEISPATLKACNEAGPGLRATLYYSDGDPRTRRTRHLLDSLARSCELEVRSRILDHESADADTFEIASSNSVVLQLGESFETVQRSTEGAIYEALYRLRSVDGGKLVALRGEGEGDLERGGDRGFSGLFAALTTEGYEIHSLVTSAMDEVPDGTLAVLALSPQRAIRSEGIDALRRYLERGGRLVALLEPGVDSGLEGLLAEYGITSPNAVLIDPASGSVEATVKGLNPIAYNYSTHPVTHGLDRNRMTFFAGARSFTLRKLRVGDKIEGVVLASPRSWLNPDLSILERRSGRPEPDGAREDYFPLVVTGRYPREAGETRIVAFGDSDFASNRYLRAVYNLDLILNAVHWAAEREPEITTRPKAGAPLHFPLPIADSLRTLYGVGILVPEILLILGGTIWLSRRSA
jgi:hypothetical protein